MIEVVFSESAYGSLKVAQHYGVGKYHGAATSVFLRGQGGAEPTKAQMQEAQKRAEERAQRDWENAIPLGGRQEDLYFISLAWSVGEISENGIGFQRREVMEKFMAVWPRENAAQMIDKKLQDAQTALAAILERCSAGETIRVWYSHNPDEMCGMYWILAQLRPLKQRGSIYLVKLPEWEYTGENTVSMRNGWGEIGPGEWGRYLPLQQETQPAFLSLCATKWSQLKEENAPLRVFLNGQLQSASEDIYDSFILREIIAQPEEFNEAFVIGNVLGKYQLGIGDAWVAQRIDKMIAEGKLEIVERAPSDHPVYRQKLRKAGAL
ncbi:MAG: DUF1835 domain-containing protein [Oscillospiraceae bacterium]|nr:DUF1835 domain-containing protein [Oscillospiraceae bacterium]